MGVSLFARTTESSLWSHVENMQLTTNVRVRLNGDLGAVDFSNQLMAIGNGEFAEDPVTNLIALPNDLCRIVENQEQLIEKVYPAISTAIDDSDWLCNRAILAPKNDDVEILNLKIQDRVQGRQSKTYRSFDETVDPKQAVYYPTEFSNTLNIPGVPKHLLTLKEGSPIPSKNPPRLCNGTRLNVVQMMNNLIIAKILSGPYKDERVVIPRIPFIPDDLIVPIKRTQFPVRLAFDMTINKAQGQSLKTVGIDLSKPRSAHGQLYVACSRVGNASNLYVQANDGKTKNVVYRQALR